MLCGVAAELTTSSNFGTAAPFSNLSDTCGVGTKVACH